jgi:hypothetical protein
LRVRSYREHCHRKKGGVNKKQSDLRVRRCRVSSSHDSLSF